MTEIYMSDIMGSPMQQKRHLDGCNFRFFPGYKVNAEKSKEVGYAQHDEIDYIEIIVFNGEKTVREVQDRDKRAYPEQWARYEQSKQKPKDGYSLKEWPLITPAMLADLLAYGLTTIEETADLTEDTLQKLPFLQEPNRLANAWLESAKSKQAQVTKLKGEIQKLEENYKKLEDQYYAALQRIEATEGIRFNA